MSVILLHGFGDTGGRFLSDTFALLQRINGLRLIIPQAPEENLQGQNLQSWFLPTNGQWIVDDTVAKPIVAYVHAMVRREIARGVQPSRIVLGGFAQGGSCAVRAAMSFPDAALGGALFISAFFGAPTAAVLPANQGLKVLVCHGKSDEMVPFAEGERAAGVMRGLLTGEESVTFKAYDMKHGVATDEVLDVLEFVDAVMEAAPEEPLVYDPVKLSEETRPTAQPPVVPPSGVQPPAVDPGAGVPTMEPSLVLELLNDPDIAEAVKDPEGMAVVQDAIMNPESLQTHRGNPRVAGLIEKLLSKGVGAAASSAD